MRPGERPAGHRLQPAGPGAAVGPLRRRQPARRARAATTRCSCPRTSSGPRPLIAALRDVADAHGATPAQVALAWVIRQPNVVAIPGASSVAQLEANVAAADLELGPQEIEQLTEASDRFSPKTGVSVAPDLVRARLGR